jgi:hypothetical protein
MVHMRRAFLRNLPNKGDRRWSVSVSVHGLLQRSGCELERSHCRYHQVSCTAVGISITNSPVTLLTNVRTAIFAWTQCGSQVISLLGPAISSTAMTRGLWLPFGLGIGCLVLVIPCVLVLPETRPWIRQTTLRKPSHTGEETDQDVNSVSESSPLLSDDMPANIPEGNGVNEDGTGENLPLRDFARKQFGIAKRSFRDMKNLTQTNPSFGLCLLIFLVSNLSKQSINILLQYTSVRYGVSFAEVSKQESWKC